MIAPEVARDVWLALHKKQEAYAALCGADALLPDERALYKTMTDALRIYAENATVGEPVQLLADR